MMFNAMTTGAGLFTLLAVTFGLTACDPASQPPVSPVATHTMTEAVPPDSLRGCVQDDDCVVVQTSCNGCCEQAAVSSRSTDAYATYKTNTCAGYRGSICNCAFRPARAVCLQQMCSLDSRDGG